jgi:dynein light intermediate chain
VTINCAERGLLLLRVRDEMRMTIMAYQTLYESSVAFGMRKALQTEQGKSDMEVGLDTTFHARTVKTRFNC